MATVQRSQRSLTGSSPHWSNKVNNIFVTICPRPRRPDCVVYTAHTVTEYAVHTATV